MRHTERPPTHRARRSFLLGAAGTLLATQATSVRAQTASGVYPNRPIRLIVPYGAGTSTDTMTRLVAPHMARSLGQPIVVENRPGASGALGSEAVSRSMADGYTLLMGAVASHSVLPSLMPHLPYNPVRDFTHVSLVTNAPNLLVVHPKVPARTLREFLPWAGRQRDKVSYASAGNGTSSHLAGELLKLRTGVQFEHVPYRSGAQAVTDVVAGQVPMLIYQVTAVLPFVREGTLRALATTSNQRLEWTPEIPTVEEEGLPDFDVAAWHGLFGPAALPPNVLDSIYNALRAALEDPALRPRIRELGLVPVGMPPAEFSEFLGADIAKWREVIRAANIKAD
jgi:tripartite-type tricarboxylate transporter receptor subunit TctC